MSIELDAVTKIYPGQPTAAVENFSMSIQPGELVVFVGPSGCGKTTTMKMINRIIEPSSGSIRIDGKDVLSLDPNQVRRHIGYVIQQVGLFPHLTIRENIAHGANAARLDEEPHRRACRRTAPHGAIDPGDFASDTRGSSRAASSSVRESPGHLRRTHP